MPAAPEGAEPLIVLLCPACDVPLVVPVPVDGVVPAVPAPVPAVDPLPLVVPVALPEPVAAPVLLPEPLAVEPVAPAVLPEGLPDVEEPAPEALPIEAFVSIQLLPEPARHPVTVTVFALELLALVEPVWSAGVLVVDPLVPVVPLVPCVPLVDPLCAATLTAKAKARPEAVVTTRFMCNPPVT